MIRLFDFSSELEGIVRSGPASSYPEVAHREALEATFGHELPYYRRPAHYEIPIAPALESVMERGILAHSPPMQGNQGPLTGEQPSYFFRNAHLDLVGLMRPVYGR
ncbi:hypothetical protein H6504_00670 [Candidatus Woesearchaeota archaeon]|nr:hypothetical protein [Candidatus Woesearchaeota archaeon]